MQNFFLYFSKKFK